MKNKYMAVIFTCLLLMIEISRSHAQTLSSDKISIIVPCNVITNMIKAALPLNIEKGPYLIGNLWIHSIEHLKIGSDQLEFEMNIRGEKIKFETRLGNQTLLMDIGNLNAVFTCKVSLRYDAPKRLLYITPYILQKPNGNNTENIATNLLRLLSLANGTEYPIELQTLQPFITQISHDQFNIDMDITNIHTEDDKVFLKILPKVTKTKSMLPPEKNSLN